MSRQEAFEKIYAKLHDVTPESLAQYRFCTTDGYRLPQMASHYRVYCETMDSLAGELQDAKRYRWLRSNKKWNDAADHVPWCEDVWIIETRDDADNRSMDELDRSVDYLMNTGGQS